MCVRECVCEKERECVCVRKSACVLCDLQASWVRSSSCCRRFSSMCVCERKKVREYMCVRKRVCERECV